MTDCYALKGKNGLFVACFKTKEKMEENFEYNEQTGYWYTKTKRWFNEPLNFTLFRLNSDQKYIYGYCLSGEKNTDKHSDSWNILKSDIISQQKNEIHKLLVNIQVKNIGKDLNTKIEKEINSISWERFNEEYKDTYLREFMIFCPAVITPEKTYESDKVWKVVRIQVL